MTRPRLLLLVLLAVAGCMGAPAPHAAVPATCFADEPPGAALQATAQDAYAGSASDAPGVAVNATQPPRFAVSAGQMRDAHHVIRLGARGVELAGGVVRLHVEVATTDVALATPETPRLDVTLARPLAPGAYSVVACIQRVSDFPRAAGAMTNVTASFEV